MTIKYCDFLYGNDTTGDGSYSNPYKTIDKASTGLTGGDEVRVAKSPDNITLTGTLSFTYNSTTVTGNGTLFTTELSLGDYIVGPDGYLYEVISITNDTNLTLLYVYTSSSQSGVTCQKLGVIDTGAATSQSVSVQTINANGTSSINMFSISGGWDLTTQTQTGQTYFRQLHSTFSNRWGYGLVCASKSYIQINRLHFLRYYIGYSVTSGRNHIINSPICCGMNSYGITLSTPNSIINNPVVLGSITYGLSLGSYGIKVNSPITLANQRGIAFISAYKCEILNPISLFNSMSDIFTDSALDNVMYNPIVSSIYGNTTRFQSENPMLTIQNWNTANDNRMIYEYGSAINDEFNGLKFTPTSSIFYCACPFNFKADSGIGQIIGFQTKKSSTFNGDMRAAVFFNGSQIVDWTDVTPSSSDTFESKSVSVASNLITMDGVLELRVKARGSAGNCWVNTFTVS
jgi:hypothetical protein